MIFRSLRGLSGAVLVGVMILVAMLATVWTPQDPLALNLRARLAAPGGAHLLGTDEFGRDVLSRLMAGAPLPACWRRPRPETAAPQSSSLCSQRERVQP